ncbi:siderophore-interacting protein [Microbacterium suaedae]|uniref:siderophore-interacting protein n=1 Tax=Microbacterium suaedae TaxID=2067813 RepID=UPI000DA1ACED|nr:siderophore-interacting protein [Microbacterium suaedae]
MNAAKKPRPQYVFEVVSTERVSPHLMRVHLAGSGFDAFAATAAERGSTDAYVKLLFAKPELDLEPPYDLDALRERLSPEDMPSRRTYTVRAIDRESRTIAIDFVVHGDEGIAGPWAANAAPGDRLCMSDPAGKYAPDPAVDEHLFLGDDAAIPAIAAAIESLPSEAVGRALIEVGSPSDEIAISAPAGVDIRWLHRDGAPYGSALVAAVEALDRPTGSVDVFAHGEREAMKRLRPVLHTEWGIERARLSLSAYWAAGRAEDTFQAEKRQPVGQIFDDEQTAARA